jgi:hypothetical protein
MVLFNKRKIKHRDLVFDLRIKSGEENEIYFKINTKGSYAIPIRLLTPQVFYENDHYVQIILGLYYGVMLVMAIYPTFKGLSFGKKD